jgi:broad specificity phosphatase PhoE
MSKLVLVRHGQASFFSDDYDKLSEMGERQARVLAEYWLRNDVSFDEAYTGTLRRQKRTEEVVAETFRAAGKPWPTVEVLPGLDEYPSDEIMTKLLPLLSEKDEAVRTLEAEHRAASGSREKYRSFHRLLSAVMEQWIKGGHGANGMTRWEEFRDRVRRDFRNILARDGNGRKVAVFSSGGVIGVSVQSVLQAPDLIAAELNWRVHNCSLTEFTFSGDRITLDCFNAVPHLSDPELLTYR